MKELQRKDAKTQGPKKELQQRVTPSGPGNLAFNESVIENVGLEGRTLAALRDALLPKLILSELRVPDAERIVGRAV